MGQLDQLDYYTLLGVSEQSSIPEIKRAFKKFARKYHPDQHVERTPDKIERAAEIYRRGSEAYQVLTDERARAEYDKVLQTGRLRLTAEELDRAWKPPENTGPKKKRVPIKSAEALAYFKEGIAYAEEGNWKACYRFIEKALEMEPGNQFLLSRLDQVGKRMRGF